jgi:RNA polymerase sigma-70 factor (ECF subfamily)
VGAADPTSENLVEPDPAVLRELHERLLEGDRVASEQLARMVLGPLVKRLEHRWPRWSHTDRLYDAAVDAFLDYVDAPERFDVSRASLLGWLEMVAHRDVVNTYRSEKQRSALDTPPLSALLPLDAPLGAAVPGAVPVGMSRIGPDPDDAGRLDRAGMWHRIREGFPEERQREFVWACFVEQERSSDRLACILGCDHLPVEQRRRKVKNARDVALRKLRRMGLIQ